MFVETGSLPSATESLLEALEVAVRWVTLERKRRSGTIWDSRFRVRRSTVTHWSAFERAATLAHGSADFGPVERVAYANIANCPCTCMTFGAD